MVLVDYECRCSWAGKGADQPDKCKRHKKEPRTVHFLKKADEAVVKPGWQHPPPKSS